MSLWEAINDVLFTITSAAVNGGTSDYVPLSQIGNMLINKGTLKNYGSGKATQRQLQIVLEEIKRNGADSCEIKINGDQISIRANFRKGNSGLGKL